MRYIQIFFGAALVLAALRTISGSITEYSSLESVAPEEFSRLLGSVVAACFVVALGGWLMRNGWLDKEGQ